LKLTQSQRRYAIEQAMAVAGGINDEKTKADLVKHVLVTATGSSVYGRLVYRVIAFALGLVAILVVVFSFFLLLGGHSVNPAFWTLGSAAVGALGGVFAAPHGDGGTTTTNATTSPQEGQGNAAAPAVPGGQGNAPAAQP
jgi:hypothetical protein